MRIEEFYAFVAEDSGPDDEGLVAMQIPGGWLPMVAADMDRVNSLKPIARHIGKITGKKITLLQFTSRVEKEVITWANPTQSE